MAGPASRPSPPQPPPLGKDASEDFDEIGHSNAAKEQLTQFLIGTFEACFLFAECGHGGGWAGGLRARSLPALCLLTCVVLLSIQTPLQGGDISGLARKKTTRAVRAKADGDGPSALARLLRVLLPLLAVAAALLLPRLLAAK